MPAGSHGGSDQLIQKMANRLELDDTQRQSVQNIHDAAKPEIDALRERMKSNRESMRALDANDPNRSVLLSEIAMEKGQLTAEGILLSDRVRSEIDAVLTDEQRAKLAEGRSMMDKRRDGRSPRNRSNGRRDHDEESIEQ
jgi:Spy/CpxP family protein refolding chaperone